MAIRYTPLERKKRYVDMLASEKGIDMAMLRWGSLLSEYFISIGFNVLFYWDMNMHFNLDWGFDMSITDFVKDYMPEGFWDKFHPKVVTVKKAYYDISPYEESFYDPQQVETVDLTRFMWNMRKYTTEKDSPYIKKKGKALRKIIKQNKQFLVNLGVKEEFVDGLLGVLAKSETKLAESAYWDWGVFDISRFNDKEKMDVRSPVDWETTLTCETHFMLESHFDHDRWDHAQFWDEELKLYPEPKPRLPEILDQVIRDFQTRVGPIYVKGLTTIPPGSSSGKSSHSSSPEIPYKVPVLYQRVFMLPRVKKYHYTGGKHQLKIQTIINRVKEILNREGVIANLRAGYLSFAQQLAYLKYKPHRRWKRWRRLLTPQDLIEKFVTMGFDKNILLKIKEIVPV